MHSNLAKSLEQYDAKPVQKRVRKTRKRGLPITKGEKFFVLLFCLSIVFFSIKIISNQSTIYEVNASIQNMEQELAEQERLMEDLQAQVNELSRYDRLMSEAEKQALSMDPENVKVVQKNE